MFIECLKNEENLFRLNIKTPPIDENTESKITLFEVLLFEFT
jgi:hypothetical protein